MTAEVNDLAASLAAAAQAREAGELARAAMLFEAAAAAYPAEPAPAHLLGGVLLMLDRPAEAEAAYRRALALAPEAPGTRRMLGTLLLSLGRYAEGFELFEARHALAAMAKPELPWPEWRGEPLDDRRLLIWPEQGFGDQIMFARFAPILAAAGAKASLLCAPALQRLFAASFPGVEVAAAAGQVAVADPDLWVMAGSLAMRLGVTVETIPGAPYLTAPAANVGRAGGARIGLAWRGNPANEIDRLRSLTPDQAERLTAALPAEVVDLDPAATGAADFADTAAIMAGLDLVIAVDTAAAHLAGALGRPCWTLIPAQFTDWRWLRGRTDSPWYPTMRLYRQAPGEDWGPVLQRVIADAARKFAG